LPPPQKKSQNNIAPINIALVILDWYYKGNDMIFRCRCRDQPSLQCCRVVRRERWVCSSFRRGLRTLRFDCPPSTMTTYSSPNQPHTPPSPLQQNIRQFICEIPLSTKSQDPSTNSTQTQHDRNCQCFPALSPCKTQPWYFCFLFCW
jgi:hypothetical protein